MALKVLIVDDSGFFRRRLVEILRSLSDVEIVGTASNGREAIELTAKLRPDVITMDYEMPVMDGITAVRHIMAAQPTPVLMFSSLTYEGARVTFDALEAGAVDFLPKSFEALSGDATRIKKLLHEKLLAVARSRGAGRLPGNLQEVPSGRLTGSIANTAVPAQGRFSARANLAPITTPSVTPSVTPSFKRTQRANSARLKSASEQPLRNASASFRHRGETGPGQQASTVAGAGTRASGYAAAKPRRQEYTLVAIGTSTGGPVALQKVMTQLPADFPRPIVLVQHMPATFTPAFAERLDRLSKLSIKQAEHGEILKAGTAYIAPGGKQLLIERSGSQGRLKILEGDERLHYKPCVDVTFGSAAKMFPGKILGIILTGMGADGREGCRMLKESNSVVWSQDEESSVIYGMPMAVTKAGLADQIYALDELASRLVEGVA